MLPPHLGIYMDLLQLITLSNNQGMVVEILNYGARIKSILFPVKGVPTEMIVGHENSVDYINDEFYLGASCGRVCNRIENGQFTIDGKTYSVTQNDGVNCLHGGSDNYSFRYWKVMASSTSSVTLALFSPDGDQGFPGNVNLHVVYHLTEENELKIEYFAISDAPTPINLTNHAYFSLGEKSCEELKLQIMSSTILERKADGLPSGNFLSVKNTDFDFQEPISIGVRQQNATDDALKVMCCFDHCFVLNKSEMDNPSALLSSDSNKVTMKVFTDQPAVQLYTGAALRGNFQTYQGVCLEAQNYSNAVNHSHFPNSILLPKMDYKKNIVFKFDNF